MIWVGDKDDLLEDDDDDHQFPVLPVNQSQFQSSNCEYILALMVIIIINTDGAISKVCA